MANWEPNQTEWLEDNQAGTRYEGPRFEISPREREDMAERDRRDFDPEPDEHVWYEIRIVDDED